MITREADGTILTHAGPEIGVASTKAFTAQMIALYLFALYLGQLRGTLTPEESKQHAQQLANCRSRWSTCSTKRTPLKTWRKNSSAAPIFLFGRGINFPIALEGALKLKELSYIHAEGYPAAR